MNELDDMLARSAATHDHLCPRQVLGVRVGMAGSRALGLKLPRSDKRLLIIAETDGCFVDGITASTGCTVGHRTLRIEDFGKVAATFVDTISQKAVRVAPRNSARDLARASVPGASKWESYLLGYQRLPEEELLVVREVGLKTPVARIVSRPGRKSICGECGEEIFNEREVLLHGATLCRACAGQAYYELLCESPSEYPDFEA